LLNAAFDKDGYGWSKKFEKDKSVDVEWFNPTCSLSLLKATLAVKSMLT